MPHTITLKVLKLEGSTATLEVGGEVSDAHGFTARLVDLLPSLPYLADYGWRQCVNDAGAKSKGTPEADIKAARRERVEALKAGYSGGAGRDRLPVWVRLAATRLSKVVPDDTKPGALHLALMRDDSETFAKWATARKLNVAKVATFVAAQVAWAKKEADRRAKLDAQDIDLDDLA